MCFVIVLVDSCISRVRFSTFLFGCLFFVVFLGHQQLQIIIMTTTIFIVLLLLFFIFIFFIITRINSDAW